MDKCLKKYCSLVQLSLYPPLFVPILWLCWFPSLFWINENRPHLIDKLDISMITFCFLVFILFSSFLSGPRAFTHYVIKPAQIYLNLTTYCFRKCVTISVILCAKKQFTTKGKNTRATEFFLKCVSYHRILLQGEN